MYEINLKNDANCTAKRRVFEVLCEKIEIEEYHLLLSFVRSFS